ncbi:uncharacterized protein PADG_03510 [Paracoccidioides brasiliensis Pb18]|uniref:t-SNARE coiled-coil homology domain-containing protein n=1 Tax=Paracoccidioides brasiliensis (strain Pb18) TaxID=502780 RepID=C1G8C4_PARBD|nr:uncharacterized protein PADG_03510 [Paracoccidioides brasiliensis Pb18]EEH47426.2 hypothetical protein PADG_03510 [Paracoccidioides brasiliensis Pb18]
MSDAYVREQQNNALLDALAQKTRALKSVTIDIYDNARDHNTIENTVRGTHLLTHVSSEVFSSLSTNIRGSAGRLTRMAKQGDRIAITKVAGIVVVIGFALWLILGWIF